MKAKAVIGIMAFAVMASMAHGAVILEDNFDSYMIGGQMNAVWTQSYAVPLELATEGYSGTRSAKGGIHANYEQRMHRNFGQEVNGTDAQPLVLSFMTKVTADNWHTREYIELRGYAGSGFLDGGLEELLAFGFTSSGVDTSKLNARVVLAPAAGWFNLDATRLSFVDTWRETKMVIKSNTIEYYVDGVPVGSRARAPQWTFDCIVVGSGLSNATPTFFDDIKVETVPEPATLALLGLGGLFLRRRR